MQSKSAIDLANLLGITRIRQNGTYRWRPGHKIINWGNSNIARWMSPRAVLDVWNSTVSVALASSKLDTFIKLSQANFPIPDFTILSGQLGAAGWLRDEPKYPGLKHAVLSRTLTRANSGRGIVVATCPEELVPAPLYTRYVPKQQEYRVHVFRELGVIDVQQKKRDTSVASEDRDPYIRNHDAGWVFCRENVVAPPTVVNVAVNAVFALGLDFGAVDIGFHSDIGPCIYEVNTAPGLVGQTLVNYAEAFKQIF